MPAEAVDVRTLAPGSKGRKTDARMAARCPRPPPGSCGHSPAPASAPGPDLGRDR
ncbi:hypothetical protein [Streptomyces sp. NPDC019224]|uniref:hypothetical protein n=1 Tax=Streptomyces sp. NPDC019224 TaxID=3154484 RepID=UPI0033FF3640